MAVALTSPYIDTGITATFTVEHTTEIRQQVYITTVGLAGAFIDAGPFIVLQSFLYTKAVGAFKGRVDLGTGVDTADTIELRLSYYDPTTFAATDVLIDSVAGAAAGTPGYFAGRIFQKIVGPLRLGVALIADVLDYEWFLDASTTTTWRIDGITTNISPLPALPPPANLMGDSGRGNAISLDFGFSIAPASISPVHAPARHSLFTVNTVALSGRPPVEPAKNLYGTFGPSWTWTVDLATLDENGVGIATDALHNAIARVTPTTFTQEVQMYGADTVSFWGNPANFEISPGIAALADPWLSAQTIQPYADERNFTLEGNAPKTPSAAFTTYNVGTLRINSPLDVLLSTNAWVATGSIVVGGGATPPTTFTVTGAGLVTRALREHWRFWNTVGHPLEVFPAETYTATDRNAYTVDANTPDRWGWSLYSYLDIDLTIPAAETLTITLTWAVIDETEVVHAVTRVYTKTWAASGVQRLDLLFPDAGDTPFYGDRIDSIKIEGFVNGVTTLNDMELFAGEDAYVQLGGQTEDSRSASRLAGIKIAQDGQWVAAHWNGDGNYGSDTDIDFLQDHTSDHEGGIFEFAADETAVSSYRSFGRVPTSVGPTTIADIFTEMDRMEGITSTYSAAVLDAALIDTFGNSLGGFVPPLYQARWLKPNLPHERLAKNTNLDLFARLVASGMLLPPGIAAASFIVYERMRLGSVLEAQGRVASTGARSGAGITVNAKAYVGESVFAPTGADATIASGTTDASGYVAIPVRTGKRLVTGTPTTFGFYLE